MHFVTVLVLMRAAMFSLKRRSSTKTSNYRQNTGLYLSRIMSVQSSISLSMGDLNGFPSVTKKKNVHFLSALHFFLSTAPRYNRFLFISLPFSLHPCTHSCPVSSICYGFFFLAAELEWVSQKVQVKQVFGFFYCAHLVYLCVVKHIIKAQGHLILLKTRLIDSAWAYKRSLHLHSRPCGRSAVCVTLRLQLDVLQYDRNILVRLLNV